MLSFASAVSLGTNPFLRKYSRNSSARITYLSSFVSKFASNSACTRSQRSRMSLTMMRISSGIPFLNSNSSSESATLMMPDTSALCSVFSRRLMRSMRCVTSVISVGMVPIGSDASFCFVSSSPKERTWLTIAFASESVLRNS